MVVMGTRVNKASATAIHTGCILWHLTKSYAMRENYALKALLSRYQTSSVATVPPPSQKGEDGQVVLLVSVPSFDLRHSCVLVNLRNLDCSELTFSTTLGSKPNPELERLTLSLSQLETPGLPEPETSLLHHMDSDEDDDWLFPTRPHPLPVLHAMFFHITWIHFHALFSYHLTCMFTWCRKWCMNRKWAWLVI